VGQGVWQRGAARTCAGGGRATARGGGATVGVNGGVGAAVEGLVFNGGNSR